MGAEKYLLFSLEDEKSKKLGEVISSASCKKIVNLLAEKELSESEIASQLGMPLNTVDYNVKKLEEAGIIEKAKKWWSVKGKKIETYRVANKLIVISPKKGNVYSKLKGIVPAALISGIAAFGIYLYQKSQEASLFVVEKASDLVKSVSVSEAVAGGNVAAESGISALSQPWFWFLAGSLVAIIVFLIVRWKKI